MLANRILNFLITITSFLVVPVQLITTFILGLLVSLSFGILLIPISLIWLLLSFPMIGLSWVTSKAEWLRNPVGIIAIPWAFVANTFVALMPSMGELESRAAKLMLSETWPFSWECWQFQLGRLNLYSDSRLNEVIERISHKNPLMEQTVERMLAREPLDPNI